MTTDVLVMGEALVDFLPLAPGHRVRDVEGWKRCVGGAPANVAVGLARLGARVAMVGCTGDDEFGHFLKGALAAEGVDVSALRQTREGKTGLGFISLDAQGERSFLFYRERAAEFLLDARDVHPERLARTAALHLGTNSLLAPAAREAVGQAVAVARASGRIVSCDPNLRLHLWKEPRELQAWLEVLVPQLSVLKLSDEELGFVTGTTEVDAALDVLARKGVTLVVVTRGAAGAVLRLGPHTVSVPACAAKVVDTTGAGDGFMTGLLYGLTRLCRGAADLERLGAPQLQALGALGCALGARVVSCLGAVAGLPRRAEVEPLLRF